MRQAGIIAELMLVATRAQHSLRGAGDDRAEWATETLREADRDRVRMRGDRRRFHAARDRRVEEARAVEVERELELPAGLGHRLDLGERPDSPTGGVVGVLDRHDPRRRPGPKVAPAP